MSNKNNVPSFSLIYDSSLKKLSKSQNAYNEFTFWSQDVN